MPDKEAEPIAARVAELMRHEYIILHKDNWRVYWTRTLAALIVVGGVTTVAVWATIYGASVAATQRRVQALEEEAEAGVTRIGGLVHQVVGAGLEPMELNFTEDGERLRANGIVNHDGWLVFANSGSSGVFMTRLTVDGKSFTNGGYNTTTLPVRGGTGWDVLVWRDGSKAADLAGAAGTLRIYETAVVNAFTD